MLHRKWELRNQTDVAAEVAVLTMRAIIMNAIRDHIQSQRWTHDEACQRMKVTHSWLEDINQGKVAFFLY